MAEEQQGKAGGGQNQCDIEDYFYTAEFFAADLCNGFDDAFAGNHQYIGGNFDTDAQCQNGAALPAGKVFDLQSGRV